MNAEREINSLLSNCIYNETRKTYTFTKYYYNCINEKLNDRLELKKQLFQLQQENEELKSKIKEVKAKVKDYVCTEEYCGYIGKVTTKFILDIKSILDKEGDK